MSVITIACPDAALHPAIDPARHIVQHDPEAHSNALRIVLVNLMNAPAGYDIKTLRLVAEALAPQDRPVHVTFWRPTAIAEETPEAKAYCEAYYQNDLDLGAVDRVIVSGRIPQHEILTDEPYYGEITALLEAVKQQQTPTIAFCLVAHIGLQHFHGIMRKRLPEKLFGVFKQYIVAPDAPFVRGIKSGTLDMPVSRFYFADESGIVGQPAVQVLATSGPTGASIVQDGVITYITGHPEYAANTLKLEYERDLGLESNRVPQNYNLENPQNTWQEASCTMLHNFFFSPTITP